MNDLKNTTRHAACRWCYEDIPLEQFCAAAKDTGLVAIDLLETSDFAAIRKYDLDCPVVTFPTTTTRSGIRPPHSPTPVPVLTVSGAAGSKAIS